jgi:hypothetical protein
MIITDTLNGRTVVEVRRIEGGVRFYTDSSTELDLYVNENGVISVKPKKLILPERPEELIVPGERLKLSEAFQGYEIEYAAYTSEGNVIFACEPLKHNREMYKKAHGRREITLTHTDGVIDELPKVSARVKLPGLKVMGVFN